LATGFPQGRNDLASETGKRRGAMKLPVFKAIGATFGYFATHGLGVVKALWLPTLLFTGAMLFLLPKYFAPVVSLMELGPTPSPQQAAQIMGPAFQWIGLLLLAAFLFQPMAYVGAMRHVLRGQELKAPFYLGFGGDELRVAATFILMIILIGIVYVIGVLGLMALTAALGALGQGAAWAGALAGILGIALFGFILWIALRLSLSLPAAVAEKRIGLPYSWRAGKGNTLRLLLFFFIFVLIMIPAVAVYVNIMMPDYFSSLKKIAEAGTDIAKSHEIQTAMMKKQMEALTPGSDGYLVRAAGVFLYNLFMNALWTIPPAIAYRFISGDAGKAR
jgi:hypothetical protein